MLLPQIRGMIDRRMLVNFRVDPEVLARLLPAPFEPQTVGGYGIAGICLIRLVQVRPWFAPAAVGMTTENAAYRMAVRWQQDGTWHEGVYVPRRETSSRLVACCGGRLFPGVHHHARFEVSETHERYQVQLASDDGQCQLAIAARVVEEFPASSVFGSLAAASRFLERGSLGYSATRRTGRYDGLELQCARWQVQPLQVDRCVSSYLEDPRLFPSGSAALDSALLMKGVPHVWNAGPRLICQQKKIVKKQVQDFAV